MHAHGMFRMNGMENILLGISLIIILSYVIIIKYLSYIASNNIIIMTL